MTEGATRTDGWKIRKGRVSTGTPSKMKHMRAGCEDDGNLPVKAAAEMGMSKTHVLNDMPFWS